MKREHRKASFDASLIPLAEEVQRYDPRRDGHCCTAERFRPDLTSPPATAWNKSAIAVFARSFIDSDEYECDDISAIKKVFATHLRHLSRKYKTSISGEADKKKAKKKANREERKRGLFNRRLTAALSYDALKPHVTMIRQLGVDGMSSDESSVENDITHYEILQKRWRHPDLTAWLRAFDAIYRKMRVSETNRNSRGAAVHWRQVTTRFDNSRAAVPCLPKNAYSQEWLDALQEMDREDLAVHEQCYDFTHTAQVMQ
ncbi:hypothetical protein BC628DRAFT_1406433 [Trametes gibbosa]|nr:hypothetical protein C2E23DRAFT_870647 [Lenzites betulinus]KAI0833365.1 hypothetical protein BC628DRAFT_1406433 [Trametes gibbosa]